jgi:lipid A 3-O-deacylase
MTVSLPSRSIAALAALLITLPAFAIDLDSASLELGGGNQVRMLRLGVQSNFGHRWFQSRGTHISGYWDAAVSEWRGNAYRNVKGERQYITVFGLTPVFRLQADDLTGWYLEGGIGANLLTKLYDNNDDHLSTSFQFNDHVGAGYVFQGGWDVGIKLEHFSNGGIKSPNSGVNFVMLKVARKF